MFSICCISAWVNCSWVEFPQLIKIMIILVIFPKNKNMRKPKRLHFKNWWSEFSMVCIFFFLIQPFLNPWEPVSPKNRGTFKPARNTNLPRSLDPVCLAPRVPIPYFCRVLYIDHLNKGFISWIMAASLLINLVQKKMSRKSSKE